MRKLNIKSSFWVQTAIWIYCLFPLHSIYAQALSDSAVYSQSLDQAFTFYKKTMGENLHLYSGNEYVAPSAQGQKLLGNPYFLSDQFLEGSIHYDGSYYEKIPMHFQIQDEKLILTHPVTHTTIELLNEKISNFTISNYEFFKIPPDIASLFHTSKLYYNRLYNGSVIIWVLRDKKYTLSAKAEDQTATYKEYDQFFLQKGTVFFSVESEKGLLKVLPEKKAELKKFIRLHHLKFNADIENNLLQAVQYYDQIKNL
jgi:hypothetical protein